MRIVITGNSGAGKTSLAKKLGEKFNLPIYHLDSIYWQENWEELDRQIWLQKVSEIVKKEKWIIEGNYASTFDLRFSRATTIIHLDFNAWFCLYRCIKRRIQIGATNRPEFATGCNERVDFKFYKFVYNYPKLSSPIVYEKVDKLFRGKFIVLRNYKECKKLEFSEIV